MLIAAGPAEAQRQRCEAPPGRAGVEQYCESLPGAGGQQGGAGGGAGRGVDGRTADRLRAAGDEGEALLSLSGGGGAAENGGAAPAGGSDSGGNGGDSDTADSSAGSGGISQAAQAEDEPSGSLLSALGSSVEDGPTLSNAFAWLLVMLALACFGLAWVAGVAAPVRGRTPASLLRATEADAQRSRAIAVSYPIIPGRAQRPGCRRRRHSEMHGVCGHLAAAVAGVQTRHRLAARPSPHGSCQLV